MKFWVILSLITHGRINFSAWLVFTFTKFWFIRYLKPRIFSRFLSVAIKFKATLNHPNQASILRWKMTLDVREGACGYTCLSTLYSLFLKNRWLSKWFKMCILINRCRQIEIPTSLSVLITGVNSLIQLRNEERRITAMKYLHLRQAKFVHEMTLGHKGIKLIFGEFARKSIRMECIQEQRHKPRGKQYKTWGKKTIGSKLGYRKILMQQLLKNWTQFITTVCKTIK